MKSFYVKEKVFGGMASIAAKDNGEGENGVMSRGWMKALIAPIGLLLLLSACQPRTYDRGYARPVVYDPCATSGYGCGGFQGSLLTSGRICPPGFRLVRVGYAMRDCIPAPTRQTYRYASAPPAYDAGYRSYGPAPCVDCGRRVREVRSEPIRRGQCCR